MRESKARTACSRGCDGRWMSSRAGPDVRALRVNEPMPAQALKRLPVRRTLSQGGGRTPGGFIIGFQDAGKCRPRALASAGDVGAGQPPWVIYGVPNV